MKVRNLVLAGLILVIMDVCFFHKTPPPLGITPPPPATLTRSSILENTLTPIPGREGTTWVRPKDGMTMVFVPAGEFTMGMEVERSMEICGEYCSPDQFADEQPVHQVTLGAYWIDRTEVTNSQYDLCVQAAYCSPPEHFAVIDPVNYYYDGRHPDYPVIYVTWFDAEAYCAWAEARLPTEAEWEKAARGTDARIYPWGNDPPTTSLAPIEGGEDGLFFNVGSFPAGASPYGALDLAGNVWEWVADWYAADYYALSPGVDPPGSAEGTERVMRGGAAGEPGPYLRAAGRGSVAPAEADAIIGFRCARAGSGE